MSNTPKKPQLSYQDKMNVIHSKRRRGDQKRISEMTGYSASYVSEVLSARYNNDEIVNYAYKIMRPRK
jgi:predicted transcriptional regulator